MKKIQILIALVGLLTLTAVPATAQKAPPGGYFALRAIYQSRKG